MVMRRTTLAILLFAAACTSAPIDTTSSLPPPVTTTTITLPAGPGECGQPMLTDERIPSTQLADEIVNRFIADRRSGEGAEGCLTDEAAQTYASPTFPTCLYTCTDLAVLELPDGPVISPGGETALGPVREVLVEYQIGETLRETMREVYTVQTVRGPGDQRHVLIGAVTVEPISSVDEVTGRQTLADFLDALADGAWDVAKSLLINGGTTDEVEQRLPDLHDSSASDVLGLFCQTALCGASYEILDSVPSSESARTYTVRFASSVGPVTVDMPVSMFDARLTVQALPPDGTPAEQSPSLEDLLFPDGHDGPVALLRYGSLQSDSWYAWPAVRSARNVEIVGDAVLFDGTAGAELATLGDGTVDVQAVIGAAPWTVAGVLLDQGEPVGFVTDGARLVAYRISDQTLRTIVDASDQETTIYCSSVGGDSILVTSGIGDSTFYDLYSFADGTRIAQFEPDKASGCGVLAPDGSVFVYSAEVSLHSPQTVVLASAADGSEIDRWSILADARIGSPTHSALSFDGRYVVADLMVPVDDEPYVQNPDIGRRFVVDTQTGDQWMVDTSAQVLFPPG